MQFKRGLMVAEAKVEVEWDFVAYPVFAHILP